MAESEELILQRILERRGGPGVPLPPLREDQLDLGILAGLKKFLGRLLDQIGQFLRDLNLIPDFKPGEGAVSFFEYLVIFTVLAVVGYLIYRWARPLRAQRITAGSLAGADFAPEQALLAQFEEAVRHGQFQLAARARWLLFLRRAGHAPFTTPMNIADQLLQHGQMPPLAIYRLMFAPSAPDAVMFERFLNSLESIEGRESAAAPGGLPA